MDTLKCAICQHPVQLETAKTDENGKAVHEDCYVQQLLTAGYDWPSPQHRE